MAVPRRRTAAPERLFVRLFCKRRRDGKHTKEDFFPISFLPLISLR